MRQMPSVTDTTVPCVRTSAPVSRFWIRERMSSLISDGLSCMERSWSGAKSRAHRRKLRLHRSVEHRVAYGNSRAADQVAIDGYARLDLSSEALLERRAQLLDLQVGELERAFDRRLGGGFGVVLQAIEHFGDLRQKRDALRFDEHADEISCVAGELVAADRKKKRFLRGRIEPRIAERLRDARIA